MEGLYPATQYADRNATRRDYLTLKPDELLVSRTFLTFQGEGPFFGTRAFFIRTAGCNRGNKRTGCEFCDADFRMSDAEVMTVEGLCGQAVKALGESHGLVVITGGEPMLQPNLQTLILRLYSEGFTVQIESNGDLLATGYLKNVRSVAGSDRVALVVSPKIVKSIQTYRTLDREVLRAVDYLKFLVDSRQESPYHDLPAYVADFDPARVFVQPITVYKRSVSYGHVATIWDRETIDHDATASNHRYAGQLVVAHGYKLSVQSHLLCQVE